ncbi:IPP transferase-domain-containing protein [Xylariomycetidae sp. FL0641]|nr:IPP transferase-domain-containing protein [Xylariomycetidae sp. FL0641]
MSSSKPPREPLVVVIGSTGTGKSDLAVDLAVRFKGEIINADAMQMYRGLPVITNQITPDEKRGIQHHLLATLDPLGPTWTNRAFAREAKTLINEIRSRGNLPIVVGGTHYYVDSLLFEGRLTCSADADDGRQYRHHAETRAQFPILDQPTEVLLKRLREVDPEIAERWHPDDRRKIRRSLEIFLTTGEKASDSYEKQKQAKEDQAFASRPWDALVFWVYSDREVLKERLNRRVDSMEQRGLMNEVEALGDRLSEQYLQGEAVDRTRGIWQSIGYKQMEPFLEGQRKGLDPAALQKLKETGLEEIRAATRQYAQYQLRWIRRKSIPAFKERDAMDMVYLLDSTNAQDFTPNVLYPAADLCSRFLDGQKLCKPTELSPTAKSILTSFEEQSATDRTSFKVKTCEICGKSSQTEDQWQRHIKGKKHRRIVLSKKRLALVPSEQQAHPDHDQASSNPLHVASD